MADDVIRERRQVENLRLDLDSAKSNFAQIQTQESEECVNLCQDKFLESQAIFKGLLENAIMQLETHQSAWEVFIDSRRTYMLNGVTKANEIIDSFNSNLESSSLRTSTTEISDLLTTPDTQVNEAPVDIPVDISIEHHEPYTEPPTNVTIAVQDTRPKRNSSILSFLPKLFRSKSTKSKEIEHIDKQTGDSEIEISGSSEAEVIQNMKLELTKLLHERNELKESLRNARSCPICSEMYNTGIRSATKLKCAHVVCIQCAILWLDAQGGQAACPTCRLPYKKKDMQKVQLDL